MNIKSIVYEQLTSEQRLVATLDAMSRDDKHEVDRLRDSCSNFEEHCYVESTNTIRDLAMSVEYELTQLALWFMAWQSPQNKDRTFILQEMSNIEEAWEIFLNEQGIKKDTILNAFQIRNPMVALLMEDLLPPDQDAVNERLINFRKRLNDSIHAG